MAGTVIADNLQAAATSTLVIKNGVANTPPTIQDSAGTEIGKFCRAWVNFNGTGTVAIRASFNVTSITDNGTGNYTVNFTNAMADVNYSTIVTSSTGSSGQTWLLSDAGPNLNSGGYNTSHTTTSSIRILGGNSSNSLPYDAAVVNVSIFR